MKTCKLCYNKNRKCLGGYMYLFMLLFMRLLIFSMIGYVVEMITCAIIDKKWTNRGFFCGPIIPIYGFGCLFLSWLLSPFKSYFAYLPFNILLISFLGMLITTTLEYLTAYFLEKIFHNKWWNYEKEKFNLHGRICLKNAILFAIASPIVVYILDPVVTRVLLELHDSILVMMGTILFFITFLDVVYSCIVAYNLRSRIIIVQDLKNEKLTKIPGMLEKILSKRLKGVTSFPKRLLMAFPDIWKGNEKEFHLMQKIALKEKKKKELEKKNKKYKNRILR